MDIDRLRYFTVLCDSNTMKEAAEHLYITQPALSKAMKVLEYELQEQLLVASGRRVLITDKGKLIAERAKKILHELKQIAEDDLTGESEYIRMGSFEVFTTYFLSSFINKQLRHHKIQLRELIPGQLEKQIALGNIDIGITYLPIPNSELEFIKVGEIRMGIFGKSKVYADQSFHDLPFVIPITPLSDMPHKVKGLDGWPDDKVTRQIKYQVELMESALELCRQGLAVAYLPKFIAKLHNKQVKPSFSLDEMELPKNLKSTKQNVYLIKRKSDTENFVFRRIASALRDL